MIPRFPVFVLSKGRAETATTPSVLDALGVPHRVVVEASELDAYAARYGRERLLILDESYRDRYDSCDPEGDAEGISKGGGPARNFIWDIATAEGAAWHWIMDDNIEFFARLHEHERIPVGDGTIFHAMETFVLRYRNVAMAGPHYWMFALSRLPRPPFITGSRVYSCVLLRNDIDLRWRGRYNEDVDLSLRILKAGWATVLFSAFLQRKMPTQTLRGGNTDAFYAAKGTLPKSQMLVRLHPDVAKLSWKYGRWHHHVDYSRWLGQPLLRREDYDPSDEPEYRFAKVSAQASALMQGRRRTS